MSIPFCETQVIKVGSRCSNLAKVQVKEVLNEILQSHSQIEFETTWKQTSGDIDQKTSLRGLEKTNFFTKEIDELLLNQTIRIAIHSAKDLPAELPEGLKVVAITMGVDSSDSLVLRRGENLASLPKGAKIATSTINREEAVKALRNDVTFCDVRGTIEQRLSLLQSDDIHGVVIAEAALIRLNLTHLNRISLPGPTTPLQGQLAVVARSNDDEMEKLFASIDSRKKTQKALYLGLDPKAIQFNGKVDHYPVIAISPYPVENTDIQKCLTRLKEYTHCIFTSKNAVRIFLQHIKDPSLLKDKYIIAVGEATAQKLRSFNLKVHSIPTNECSEGIIDVLQTLDLENALFLYPHSAKARPILLNFLRKNKISFEDCELYKPVFQQPCSTPSLSDYDTIFFSSPSTIDGFLNVFHTFPKDKNYCCVGPVTKAHLERYLKKQLTQSVKN